MIGSTLSLLTGCLQRTSIIVDLTLPHKVAPGGATIPLLVRDPQDQSRFITQDVLVPAGTVVIKVNEDVWGHGQ